MALVSCSECGRQISDKAAACPNCGAPLSAVPPAPAVDRDAATLFRNPRSNETISIKNAGLYTLLFGFFYFAVRGVWTHAVAGAVLAFLTLGISWLIYPAFAQGIIRRHLLDTGWVPKAAESAKVDRRGDAWIWGFFLLSIIIIVVLLVINNPV